MSQLNRFAIDRVNNLFLTHWHPDHTAGFRVVEQVNGDVASLRYGLGARACTEVWMNEATAARLAGDWRHYERAGFCHLNVIEAGSSVELGTLSAAWFGYAREGFLSGFLLTDGSARVLLVLDETKDLATQVAADPALQSCDLLIAECGWFGCDPRGEMLVGESSPVWLREAGFERDTLPLIEAARAERTILTHLSDAHGHTPAEFDSLSESLRPSNVTFAYDGMQLVL